MSISPIWAAVRAVRDGLSATQGLNAFREGGGRIATGTWRNVYSEVSRSIERRAAEVTAPLNRRPTRDEISTFPGSTYKGFIQQVDVYFRRVGSNSIEVMPFSYASQQLRSRGYVINSVIDTLAQNADEPDYEDQVILGVAYVGTYAAGGRIET